MFRIAKYEDIEEISKLRVMQQKDDWKELYPNKDEEFYMTTKNYLEEHLNKDIIFFIEIIENKIVATCGLQVIKYMPQCVESGIEGYICDVFTLNEYRRKGIQTNLIKECIKFSKKNNIIELKLSSNNPEAIRIYQGQGFVHDELIMKREIKEDEVDE
ncbi:MAG: GNAT family N-acetyltransferase [Clostridia bacterium]|jgi:ribosomal protein S18 acetylase RimI-like enzyme|nr:GNAT family N-acetyltransferase [Clostridia bacterium]